MLTLDRTAQAELAGGTAGLVDDFNMMVDDFAEYVEMMVRVTGRQRCTNTSIKASKSVFECN